MRMRSMRSVVAVATMTAAMAAFAGPAVADDGIGERLENRLENRAERVENFYDNRGFGVDIDVDDDDVYYSPLVNPFYGCDGYEGDHGRDCLPTTNNECEDGGWQLFDVFKNLFKNQGGCV